MSYPQGATVVITAKFFDNVTGEAVDALNLKLHVSSPDGTVTTYEGTSIVRVEAGYFRAEVALPDPGKWNYRWDGTGLATPDYLINVNKSHILELMAV